MEFLTGCRNCFTDRKTLLETSCGHKFCQDCLIMWHTDYNTCKYCSKKLPSAFINQFRKPIFIHLESGTISNLAKSPEREEERESESKSPETEDDSLEEERAQNENNLPPEEVDENCSPQIYNNDLSPLKQKIVYRILDSEGRKRRYKVEWSDGSISIEKFDTIKGCGSPLKNFLKRRTAMRVAKHRARNSANLLNSLEETRLNIVSAIGKAEHRAIVREMKNKK